MAIISKEKFLRYTNTLKQVREADLEMSNLFKRFPYVFPDSDVFLCGGAYDTALCLLEDALELKNNESIDTFLWWCEVLDYGEWYEPASVTEVNGVPVPEEFDDADLSSPEKFYDYIIWLDDYLTNNPN